MTPRLVALLLSCLAAVLSAQTPVSIDLAGVVPEAGLTVRAEAPGLVLRWPAGDGAQGEIVFNLEPNRPLLERLAIGSVGAPAKPLLQRVDPVTLLTVGERNLKDPAGWVAFFDNPPLRAYQTVPVVLRKASVRVSTSGSRTLVRLGDLSAGSFRGSLEFTVVRHSPLVHVEAVLSTLEDGRAILYDAGLASPQPDWPSLAWRDASGALQHLAVDPRRVLAPLRVAGRTVVAEGREGGGVAVFTAPHRYFYPLDFADNLGFAWQGASGNAQLRGYGFGIRQPPEGDRRWVPWVNAPPGSVQRLGIFYYLSAADAAATLDAVARFTHGDRYRRLPGHATFTSHYHIEHALEVLGARQRGPAGAPLPPAVEAPGFVRTFKARGVDIVHLGEFHVGGTPRLAARERLLQLKTLHEECARLSDAELLVLPGEEPNVHLGGHWMSFFPKPVYWVLNRPAGAPFAEEVPGYGTVYQVGSAEDVLNLMRKENGLMWTAHARIKGSRTFPDGYWEAPFFRSDRFLGAAWKAMPADLSQPRLGTRVLDLLDDFSNAGLRKHVIAEADLFRMEPDYETYAHMNINYLRLDKVPRFADGWSSVLAALRGGRFFSTTGEVLVTDFRVGGRESGEVLRREGSAGTSEVRADLEWTFPLAFAEIISGDGRTVHRQRIDLSDTEAFGRRSLKVALPLAGLTWVRLEAWDLAGNGAFTQPVWIE